MSQARSPKNQTPPNQTLQIRCRELRNAPRTPNVAKHLLKKALVEKSSFFPRGLSETHTARGASECTASQHVTQFPANGSVSHLSFASTFRAQPDISDCAVHTALFQHHVETPCFLPWLVFLFQPRCRKKVLQQTTFTELLVWPTCQRPTPHEEQVHILFHNMFYRSQQMALSAT